MEYLDAILGFVGGLSLVVITTLIKTGISNKSDSEKKITDAEYELFNKLGNLYNWYFWLATNELHKKETDQDIISNIHDVSLEIAKLLHENEKTEFAKELLKILYDEGYKTYNERWNHMGELSSRMAKKVVPLHCEYIKELNDSNLILMAKDKFIPKAPASARFKIGV